MNSDSPVPLLARQSGDNPPSRPSRLRKILDEQPEARPRIGQAVAALLGTALISLAALSALLIWHLIRRGRLIQERLSAPRIVRLPELPTKLSNPPSTPPGSLTPEIDLP